MHRRLYRSETDKMMGGVAGGLAEYFEVDPVIIRAAFIISTIAWGISLLSYIVLWIIVPVNPVEAVVVEEAAEGKKPAAADSRKNKKKLVGFIFIAVGIFIIMDNFIPFLDFDMLIAAIFVIVGIYLLFKSGHNKKTGELHENG